MSDHIVELIQLTPQQKQNFSANLKTGLIKELEKRGLLTGIQTQKILTNKKR